MTASGRAGRLADRWRARLRTPPPKWTWIVAGSTVLATVAVLAGLPPLVRAPLVTWVAIGCPAFGFAQRSGAADALARGVIGGLGAVGSATIAAELLLLGHLWSPIALLIAMGALATLLVTLRSVDDTGR